MSLKRGISRAVLAFGLPWVAFWSWTYWDAAQKEVVWRRYAEEAAERQHGLAGDALLHANDWVRSARDFERSERKRQDLAIRLGAIAPVALAIFLAVCLWVWRGFRVGPNK